MAYTVHSRLNNCNYFKVIKLFLFPAISLYGVQASDVLGYSGYHRATMSNSSSPIKQLQDNRMLLTPHEQTAQRGVKQPRGVRESMQR